MIQHKGIFLPDGETHLTDMIDRGPEVRGVGTYQYKKYLATMKHTPGRGGVIDVGAHVGLWSMHFVQEFDHVWAYEPVRAHRECFVMNMEAQHVPPSKYGLFAGACGNQPGFVFIESDPHSSGDSYPTPDGTETSERAEVVLIDDYDLQDISLIKADCEGYELYALMGAEATIIQWKPTIIVEQKPGRAQKFGLKETEAVTYLEGLGMKLAQVLSGDFIMIWD